MNDMQATIQALESKLASEKSRADKAEATLDKMRKRIRCIYCDAEYTAEQKDELADHILSCAKSPLVTLCREYEGMLDLMVDEFVRITALTDNSEIHGLCDRAMSKIKTAVPVITERDELQDKLRLSESEVSQRIDAMREQAAEIDALKARKSIACFKCDDGHTPLYCLNCARDGWTSPETRKLAVEALEQLINAVIKLNNNCYPLEYCSEETRYRWLACKNGEAAIAALKEDA